eukprot:GHVO01018290.1.p1 GENE.GHVO01018290.1~~GHVO01018290.1.p1  ORF type:complete len:107 (+),score=18.34 GHVO01018290.1:51-371(+)
MWAMLQQSLFKNKIQVEQPKNVYPLRATKNQKTVYDELDKLITKLGNKGHNISVDGAASVKFVARNPAELIPVFDQLPPGTSPPKPDTNAHLPPGSTPQHTNASSC